MKLSKRAEKLLSNFDEAAQSWGWQSDQGYGSKVDRSEELYLETRAALVRMIARLEKKASTVETGKFAGLK